LNEPLKLKVNWSNVNKYYVIRNNEVIKIRKKQFSLTVNSCSNQFHNLTHSLTSLGNFSGEVHQNANTLLGQFFNIQEIIDLSKHNKIENKHKSSLSSHLKCIYTNATFLNNKFHELTMDIIQNEASVVFISETWWSDTAATHIVCFNLFRRDRDGRGGGVCIYIKKDL
jgi:hypothetical protein